MPFTKDGQPDGTATVPAPNTLVVRRTVQLEYAVPLDKDHYPQPEDDSKVMGLDEAVQWERELDTQSIIDLFYADEGPRFRITHAVEVGSVYDPENDKSAFPDEVKPLDLNLD